jgi:hypothetical protein
MSHVKKLASGKYQARYRGSDGREHARNFGSQAGCGLLARRGDPTCTSGSWTHPKAGRGTLEEWSATHLGDLHMKGATARPGPLAWHSPASVWPVESPH